MACSALRCLTGANLGALHSLTCLILRVTCIVLNVLLPFSSVALCHSLPPTVWPCTIPCVFLPHGSVLFLVSHLCFLRRSLITSGVSMLLPGLCLCQPWYYATAP